jgi:thiamine monophosphate synthase
MWQKPAPVDGVAIVAAIADGRVPAEMMSALLEAIKGTSP